MISQGHGLNCGAVITDQTLLDSIVWKENSTSYSKISELHDTQDNNKTHLQGLEEYRVNELGNARLRWKNQNKPLISRLMPL